MILFQAQKKSRVWTRALSFIMHKGEKKGENGSRYVYRLFRIWLIKQPPSYPNMYNSSHNIINKF